MVRTIALALATLLAVAAPAVDLRSRNRILIITAASEADPALGRQRETMAGWHQGAADRDLETIEIVGDRVTGSAQSAAALRARYTLPPDRFAALLVGKDGTVAFRATTSIPADELEARIDAMPMRRAGER